MLDLIYKAVAQQERLEAQKMLEQKFGTQPVQDRPMRLPNTPPRVMAGRGEGRGRLGSPKMVNAPGQFQPVPGVPVGRGRGALGRGLIKQVKRICNRHCF